MDVLTQSIHFIFSQEGAVVVALLYAVFRTLSEIAPLIGRLLSIIPGMDAEEMASDASNMMRKIAKIFAWIMGGDTSKIDRKIKGLASSVEGAGKSKKDN